MTVNGETLTSQNCGSSNSHPGFTATSQCPAVTSSRAIQTHHCDSQAKTHLEALGALTKATKSSIIIPGWPLAERHHLSVCKHCLHWGMRMKTSLAVPVLGSLPAALTARRGDQFPEWLHEVILSQQAFSSLKSSAGQSRHNSGPLLWDLLPEASGRKPGCSPGCTQTRELPWSSSPPGLLFSELGDTGGKRLRESRKETTLPAQSVLNLAWEHPHAADSQGSMGSAKPLSTPRTRSWSRDSCSPEQECSGERNLHLNERNIFQRGSNRQGGTHLSLQQGFLLQSLWCTAQHPAREGKELSWEVLGAQAADPGSGASLRAREISLEYLPN